MLLDHVVYVPRGDVCAINETVKDHHDLIDTDHPMKCFESFGAAKILYFHSRAIVQPLPRQESRKATCKGVRVLSTVV